MDKPLSPEAQAVLDAYGHCRGSHEVMVNAIAPGKQRLAAALRVVAEELVAPWDPTAAGAIHGVADELDPQP